MSAQARRERAYRNYVQKQIKQRQKAMAKAQKAANRQLKEKMKLAQPSEPRITSGVESVPNSWSEPTADQVAAPPASDQVVPPITVSASNEIMATQNPDQPSPP
jgi:regulator of protease activity HflC (stomatin/prohibitin superfamily)